MASVSPSKGHLSTSTPIQQHDSGYNENYEEYFLNPMGKEIDVVSPIRKADPRRPSRIRRNLFYSFHDADNSDVSDVQFLERKNKLLSDFIQKSVLSNFINHHHVNNDDDSGIRAYSQEISFSSEDPSIHGKLVSHSTDENGNIIGNEYYNKDDNDNSSYFGNDVSSESVDPYQYKSTKTEKPFSILDNRIKVVGHNHNEIKNQDFDILGELNQRNCFSVLSNLLSYLSDEDLRKASYISKEWKSIVYSDKTANDRRKAYIQKKRDFATGSEKENRFHVKCAIERNHKSALLSVINSPAEVAQPKFSQIVGKFDSFIQEAQNLEKNDKLLKCPICCYPSKPQSGDKYCCSRNLCQHIFCKKCLGPYLDVDNHSCSVPQLNATVPNITIGSKKRKKNLRRL